MEESQRDNRPGLAIIANCLPPYRLYLNRLISAGIPELKLHTLISHADADFRWTLQPPASIHVSYFNADNDSPLASTFNAPFFEWQKGGRFIEYLCDHDVKAVICVGYRYISYLRTIQYCHQAGIPLFVRNDSNIRSERPLSHVEELFKSRIYAWWLKRVSGVMSMGEYGDQFFAKYGSDTRRLYRVPYTPDYEAYARVDDVQLQQFHRTYGLCGERKYLIYSGRLVPVKRVDLLIDAFALIASRRPDWDLLVVGDGVLKNDLCEQVPEDLRSRVIWTGFLEQEQLVAAYHAASVLVLPSDREPWAVVVQEAIAAGMIVVASDVVGASREIVENNVSGRIFAAGNRDELADALLDVTNSQRFKEYQAQSRLALQKWRSRVDPVSEIRRALSDVGVL